LHRVSHGISNVVLLKKQKLGDRKINRKKATPSKYPRHAFYGILKFFATIRSDP